jgi:subtilisin-like proprotein convertase family protein
MKLRDSILFASLFLTPPAAQAQIIETYSFSPNVAVPDENTTGIHDVRTITSSITSIADITVSLNVVGDYNGDLTIYLRHDSGFSVLLNRVGVTGGNAFGYDDHGFNVTFNDNAAHDIHNYGDFAITPPASQVLGQWQPDSRVGNPLLDDRSARLDSFRGLNPNGQWTLFMADVAHDGNSTVVSWGVQITAVPEPREYAALTALALVGFGILKRGRGPRNKPFSIMWVKPVR